MCTFQSRRKRELKFSYIFCFFLSLLLLPIYSAYFLLCNMHNSAEMNQMILI